MVMLTTPKPAYVVLSFFVFLAVLISTHMLDFSIPIDEFIERQQPAAVKPKPKSEIAESPNYPQVQKLEVPLNCTTAATKTCPRNYPTSFQADDPGLTCPDYFRWIHEDLRPWKATGITEEMIARASPTAAFRLTIVDGRVYIDQLRDWWESRAAMNIWGILQLLRRYPGKLPDLDLMFDCEDRPAILKKLQNATTPPPPLFTYCADERTFDIVFPDWSYWGWPELNIKPWSILLKELEEGNKRIEWANREPHAYWKGNPAVARTRRDLLKCNVSWFRDWNARLYKQDWIKEIQQGFKESNIADKCTYKYNIYIEGNAWSVSGKYILACDSVTLIVTPHYYDFFTRGLIPLQHYWPIRESAKCKSIKFAVNWGESHKKEAQEIGKSSTEFIMEDLKMEYVYDYMFHLLNEYGKLLKFKPAVPKNAVEYCSETMACDAQGFKKNYMMDSLEKGPATRNPCAMPPPYDSEALFSMKKRRHDSIKKVEHKETSFW
ncbi:unnamed protein product [Rhodiola kirilowii]